MKKKLIILMLSSAISLSMGGIGSSHEHPSNDMHMDRSSHSSSAEIPKGLKAAQNPIFEVGSEARIKSGHMMGMQGAMAKIVGAYDTIAYTVSYNPTTGGARVTNHRWIIQEEIKNAGTTPYKPGSEVVLEADHMRGMLGATAQIDSFQPTTVYMIDYIPTTGGEKVINHKWVTEDELSPVK